MSYLENQHTNKTNSTYLHPKKANSKYQFDINLSKPFSRFVSRQISKISYDTLIIGLIGYSARHTAKNLQHHDYNIDLLNQFWTDGQAFILMAAVIYIIATIFLKGADNQEELEETV
ncbi:MAG: hypothetical protein ACI9OT_002133 [Gammaproteobacteria bacterium]|jgi:hypothetical protein